MLTNTKSDLPPTHLEESSLEVSTLTKEAVFQTEHKLAHPFDQSPTKVRTKEDLAVSLHQKKERW